MAILNVLWYWLFGPSTTHLQHEIWLLISMVLLGAGSLSALYRSSLKQNDCIFLGILALIQSRHFLFRLWSTWTPRTYSRSITAYPSCVVSHFLQSHVIGGQTMDRPPPLRRLVNTPANGTGSTNHHTSAQDRLAQIVGTNPNVQLESGPTQLLSWIGDALPCSLSYSLEMLKQIASFPFRRIFPSLLLRSTPNDVKQQKPSWIVRTTNTLLQKGHRLWISQGMTFQGIMTTILLVFFLDTLYVWITSENQSSMLSKLVSGRTNLSKLMLGRGDEGLKILTVNTGTHANLLRRPENKGLLEQFHGAYDHQSLPDWSEATWYLFVFATFCSSLAFCRILPPLVDWIAGGNVVKDVRVEARNMQFVLNQKKQSFVGQTIRETLYWDSSMLSPGISESVPWCERHQTIAGGNRLQVSIYIVFGRVIENVLLYGIFPRTHYVCRLTGHCHSGPSVFALPCLLYPTGYTHATRVDCQASQLMESDVVSFIVTLVGVVVITTFILLAQTLLLNRSYFATLAHVTTDWKRLRGPRSISQVWKSVFRFSKKSPGQKSPAIWELGRRYRENDIVAYPGPHSAVYQATCNAPDGHPPDDHLLPAYEILRNELGSPGASNLLQYMASIQLELVLFGHLVLTIIWIIVAGVRRSSWLLWMMAAHTVAGHCILGHVSSPSGNSRKDLNDLRRLNAQLQRAQ